MNILKSFLKNFSLLLFCIFTFCLIAELTIRIFYPVPPGITKDMYIADEKLCYKWKPFFNETIVQTESAERIEINSDGFRDTNYVQIGNKTIIMSIGDSMTAAVQVPLEKTFTKLLQQKLGTDYFVMNLGVPGYNPSQYYILLEQMFLKYDPDVVLLNFFIGNDFIPSKKDFRKNKCEFTVINGYQVNADYEKKWTLFNIRMFFSRHSQLYNFVSDLINRNYWIKKILTDKGLILTDFYPEEFIIYNEQHPKYFDVHKTTFDLIKEINSLAKKHKTQLIILILPPEDHVNPKLFEETKNFYKIPKETQFNHTYEKIKNFLNKENMLFIDILSVLSNNKQETLYLQKDKHFTQKSHEIIAEHTQSFLKTHVLATKDSYGNTTTKQ